ncbi:MAG: aminodeoxychorismate synthase component I [Desulfobacteraceae bacterium]
MDKLLTNAGRLTGVHTEILNWEADFCELAARFAHLPGTVALLSGGDLDCARHHVLGAFPWLILEGRHDTTRLTIDGVAEEISSSPLDVLRAVLKHFRLKDVDWPLPMAAGLLGYLAYDLKDALEKLPKTSVDRTHLPQMLFYAPSILVVHDKKDRMTRLMVPQRSVGEEKTAAILARFHRMAAEPITTDLDYGTDGDALASNFTPEAYRDAVRRVIEYIRAGDVYQVNLSQRFQVPFEGSGFALFRHLYKENPAPFFAYIRADDHQVVSTSPERFLLRSGAGVESRPIKGTRPRGRTTEEDHRYREELVQSTKDDAELSMIVDLLRNDIGKVCAAGSVKVSQHKRLEAYQNVYHLVSVIEGEIDDGKDSVDLIEATFPGGSITGCPKVRAMEIIDELESHRRDVYCGSIGYISFHDTMDLSIAIRTATIVNDVLAFSVGGGIVFDSDPQAEYEETLHKGHTLSTACQGHPIQRPTPMVWMNGRMLPAHSAGVPVNDQGLLYGYGFFETLRVDNSHAPLLDAHLQRFEKTWTALHPGPFPDLTWEDIIAQVIGANDLQDTCAAVKILATRGSRSEPPWDHTLCVSARPYIHRLTANKAKGLHLGCYPHPRQTPLADHKTINYLYYLRAGQWAAQNGFHEALILNPDGTVSETNTANLLIISDREAVRPTSPAVLPGVMARAVSRQLAEWAYRITERPVRPDELLSAQTVLAANALMGAVPVTRVDHQGRSEGSDLWVRLNDAIIPEWKKTMEQ